MLRTLLLLGFLLFIDSSSYAQSGRTMSSVRRNIYGFRFGGSGGNIFNNNSRRMQTGYGSFAQTFSRPYRRRLTFRKVTQEMYGTRAIRFRNQPFRAGFSNSGFSSIKKNNTHYNYSRISQDYEPLSLPPRPLSLQNKSQQGFERF